MSTQSSWSERATAHCKGYPKEGPSWTEQECLISYRSTLEQTPRDPRPNEMDGGFIFIALFISPILIWLVGALILDFLMPRKRP
jgi:hypothetical protein